MIREARLEDTAAISNLIIDVSRVYLFDDFSPDAQLKFLENFSPEQCLERLRANFRYVVDERDSKIVGVIGFRDESHLFSLFVLPQYHGLGIARALFEHTLAILQGLSLGQTLTVNASRYALPFYQRLGFIIDSSSEIHNGVLHIPMTRRAECSKVILHTAAVPPTV